MQTVIATPWIGHNEEPKRQFTAVVEYENHIGDNGVTVKLTNMQGKVMRLWLTEEDIVSLTMDLALKTERLKVHLVR